MSEPIGQHGVPRPIDSPALPERAYSPGQVAGAALLGGPLGGSVLLASNFALFGSRISSVHTILLGVLATFGVMAIAVVLPENVPSGVIPAAYVAMFQQISQRSHGAQFKEFISSGGLRYSHWRVLGIGLLCLLGLFVIIFALVAFLPEQYFPHDAA